ncbi:hypothetical protein P175DRAFT_0526334 [Aspergillus ochraceoroseus IBT 24754]|uniref:Uncharacterized protein n=1 Tax=Aspergillus ochraceoroseus IBT 24754 TaxID=1392256 RepID=A0A2T5LNE6_9EURO|nr:uncharacterized protein P175DRAFT_0526334 [Aspergillus ochraceoroseus IBT 24754]PTU17804.1 hypothetical protein P175DRAFT_0526334 [Aspergillus ochraceoroseus IBT 24754]
MASRTMNPPTLLRRIYSRKQPGPSPIPPPPPRTGPALSNQPQQHFFSTTTTTSNKSNPRRALPKLAQTSLWASILPKFLRTRNPAPPKNTTTSPSKEWNPASFYIIIFILIGSQAIRMIALKNEYAAYTRSTDAKIRLLREVIEKVRAGEKVDVEKLLGTGEEAKEREWDEVLREIEREDSLWHQRQSLDARLREAKDKEKEKESEAAAEKKKKKKKKNASENTASEGDGSSDASAAAAAAAAAAQGQTKRKVNFF